MKRQTFKARSHLTLPAVGLRMTILYSAGVRAHCDTIGRTMRDEAHSDCRTFTSLVWGGLPCAARSLPNGRIFHVT